MTESRSATFVIGKLDAGMAILLTDDHHLIEFPSLLLPQGVTSGSIVDISVARNRDLEVKTVDTFWQLQQDIVESFGKQEPTAPELRLRNVTQTSLTLEWDDLVLATATCLGLDLYRNGVRLAGIPAPTTTRSTKLSGLDMNSDYSFHLVLRTTAGTRQSNTIKVRTHTITNMTGIHVTWGRLDASAKTDAQAALSEIGARASEKVTVDTTHFISQSRPEDEASSTLADAEIQRAEKMHIPIVSPEWLLACRKEGRVVPVGRYYISKDYGQRPRTQRSVSTQKTANAVPRIEPPSVPDVRLTEASPLTEQRPYDVPSTRGEEGPVAKGDRASSQDNVELERPPAPVEKETPLPPLPLEPSEGTVNSETPASDTPPLKTAEPAVESSAETDPMESETSVVDDAQEEFVDPESQNVE